MSRWYLVVALVLVATLIRAVGVADSPPTEAQAAALSETSARMTATLRCPDQRVTCRFYFRWGTRYRYRFRSPSTQALGASEVRRTSFVAAGLRPGRQYQFQLCILTPGLAKHCVGPDGRRAGSFVTKGCALYASPSGTRSASGRADDPLGTLGQLDRRLAPGQTGCLEAGSYGSIHSEFRLINGGSPGDQITIAAAPGQTARLTGLLEIEGSYITVSGLDIDGSNVLYDSQRPGTSCPYPVSNGLEIDGHHDVFENNDLYQSVSSLRGNGIGIGWNRPADGSIVRYNRIHDIGQCRAYDQMIYLAHGTGVQIYDNWLWNDPHGWGVQVYPTASNAHIYNNVIDHAGSGFVIAGDSRVHNNAIDHNVVIDSTGLPDAGLALGVGISTSGSIGNGNTFTDNDVYDNPGGVTNSSNRVISGHAATAIPPTLVITHNSTVDPQLSNLESHDYRVTRLSSALTWQLWTGNLGPLARARPTP